MLMIVVLVVLVVRVLGQVLCEHHLGVLLVRVVLVCFQIRAGIVMLLFRLLFGLVLVMRIDVLGLFVLLLLLVLFLIEVLMLFLLLFMMVLLINVHNGSGLLVLVLWHPINGLLLLLVVIVMVLDQRGGRGLLLSGYVLDLMVFVNGLAVMGLVVDVRLAVLLWLLLGLWRRDAVHLVAVVVVVLHNGLDCGQCVTVHQAAVLFRMLLLMGNGGRSHLIVLGLVLVVLLVFGFGFGLMLLWLLVILLLLVIVVLLLFQLPDHLGCPHLQILLQ